MDPEIQTTNTEAPAIAGHLKIANLINAALLLFSGILCFMMCGLDILNVLSSVYVIMFSAALIIFECPFGSTEEIILDNFGFMFRWQGRLLFYFFIGTLAFGLDTLGLIAGLYTMGNSAANVYFMLKNEQYANYIRQLSVKKHARARRFQQNTSNTNNTAGLGGAAMGAAAHMTPAQASALGSLGVQTALSMHNIQLGGVGGVGEEEPSQNSMASGSGSGTSSMSSSAMWEKFLDEKTGQYYYYNTRTQETRWSLDDE